MPQAFDKLSYMGKESAQSTTSVTCLIFSSLHHPPDASHTPDVASLLFGTSGTTSVTETSQTTLELFHLSSNHSFKSLPILCQILVDADSDPVYKPKLLVWIAAEKVSNIKANAADLKESFIHHA